MSEKFKLIVAGTRSFNDYELLRSILSTLFMKRHCWTIDWNEEIVSGGAPGADTLPVRYATEADMPFKVFPADWNKYGKSAGPRRNRQMAEYADAAIVFWDGKSRGTQNMIQQMRELGKPVEIIIYPKEADKNEQTEV